MAQGECGLAAVKLNGLIAGLYLFAERVGHDAAGRFASELDGELEVPGIAAAGAGDPLVDGEAALLHIGEVEAAVRRALRLAIVTVGHLLLHTIGIHIPSHICFGQIREGVVPSITGPLNCDCLYNFLVTVVGASVQRQLQPVWMIPVVHPSLGNCDLGFGNVGNRSGKIASICSIRIGRNKVPSSSLAGIVGVLLTIHIVGGKASEGSSPFRITFSAECNWILTCHLFICALCRPAPKFHCYRRLSDTSLPHFIHRQTNGGDVDKNVGVIGLISCSHKDVAICAPLLYDPILGRNGASQIVFRQASPGVGPPIDAGKSFGSKELPSSSPIITILECHGNGGIFRQVFHRIPLLHSCYGRIVCVRNGFQPVGHSEMISVFAIGCFIGVAVVGTAVLNHILIFDLAVLVPSGLELHDPIGLTGGQTGDGLCPTVRRSFIAAPQGDYQVLLESSASIDLDIFPVIPALLLHHKAGLPGIIARGIGTGVPLVIVVHPDFLDGDAVQVQGVGGLQVTVQICVCHNTSSRRINAIIVVATTFFPNRDNLGFTIINHLSFHHPVLQVGDLFLYSLIVRRNFADRGRQIVKRFTPGTVQTACNRPFKIAGFIIIGENFAVCIRGKSAGKIGFGLLPLSAAGGCCTILFPHLDLDRHGQIFAQIVTGDVL